MGDPACWLDQVCPACGGFLGDVTGTETVCDRCGRRLSLRDDGPVVVADGIRIRGPDPDEWALLREVRLAALADAPRVFGSVHADEVELPESTWRQRTETSALAFQAGAPVGLVGAVTAAGGRVLHLVSMWVAPAARRRGVGRRLVDHVLEHARTSHGIDEVVLWVTATNDGARHLYERCGFRPTGEVQPLPSHPDVEELRMARRVR